MVRDLNPAQNSSSKTANVCSQAALSMRKLSSLKVKFPKTWLIYESVLAGCINISNLF